MLLKIMSVLSTEQDKGKWAVPIKRRERKWKQNDNKKLLPFLQSHKCLFEEPLRPIRKIFMQNNTKNVRRNHTINLKEAVQELKQSSCTHSARNSSGTDISINCLSLFPIQCTRNSCFFFFFLFLILWQIWDSMGELLKVNY